jgi:hypothetical protein
MPIDGHALSFMVTASGRSSVSKMGLQPDLQQHPIQLRSIEKARKSRSYQIGLLSTMLSSHDLSGKPRSKQCRSWWKPRPNGKTVPSTGDQSHHPHPANPTSLNTPPTAHGTATAQRRSRYGTQKRNNIKEARWRSAYRCVHDRWTMQLSHTAPLRTAASRDGSRPIPAASSHGRPTTTEEEAQCERERKSTIQQQATALTHQQTPNPPAPTCRHKNKEKTTM